LTLTANRAHYNRLAQQLNMTFLLTVIVLAVALCHSEARRISLRAQDDFRDIAGGWQDIDVSRVPEKVKQLAIETLTGSRTRTNGVRSVEIVSARYQIVQGTNYEVTIRIHVTDCPSSASRQDINDESVCGEGFLETCNAKVYHDLEDTIRVTEMSCIA